MNDQKKLEHNMTEAILALLIARKKGADGDEISTTLKIEHNDEPLFQEVLARMKTSGVVVEDRPDHWRDTSGKGHVVGRLSVARKGFGFVIPESEGMKDVYVASTRMGGAIDGDRVVVKITGQGGRSDSPEGRILGIAERRLNTLVGTYLGGVSIGRVEPDNPNLGFAISVAAPTEPLETGLKVLVQLDPPNGRSELTGRITEVLGRPDAPGVDMTTIIRTFDLKDTYDPEALAQADSVKSEVDEEDLVGRKDLRGLTTFSIDPATAADMDDALSIEWTDDGHTQVGIHIADVSHYVKPGSPIDVEANARGTSVYLPGKVLHMLPLALSGNICSLRPEVDRLTLSVLVDLNAGGKVEKVEFARTVIRSRAKLSYEDVQAVIDGNRDRTNPATSFADEIAALHQMAQALRGRRQDDGSVDFEIPEAAIIFDADGKVESITASQHLASHKLIEEFMLLANRLVAKRFSDAELPQLYRVHEPPATDRIANLKALTEALGIGPRLGTTVTPKQIQELVLAARGNKAEAVVQISVLRAMAKARYTPTNVGHFGLACETYCHFTSPIRRYPDLVVHRQIVAMLAGERPQYTPEALSIVGSHASETEKTAETAEREGIKAKQLEYLEDRLGEVMPGTVTGVRGFGFFVRLDDSLAEGLVHVNDLEGDYFQYDEIHMRLVGERTGRIIALGDRMDVIIALVDRDARRLDLVTADKPKKSKQSKPFTHGKRKSHTQKSQKSHKSSEKKKHKGENKKGGRNRTKSASGKKRR